MIMLDELGYCSAASVSWNENGNGEYKTRTEWCRAICWNKLADWAGNLRKGAHIEVEGELRYREYTPTESDRSVRVAEIYASSILSLERCVAQNGSASTDPDPGDDRLIDRTCRASNSVPGVILELREGKNSLSEKRVSPASVL